MTLKKITYTLILNLVIVFGIFFVYQNCTPLPDSKPDSNTELSSMVLDIFLDELGESQFKKVTKIDVKDKAEAILKCQEYSKKEPFFSIQCWFNNQILAERIAKKNPLRINGQPQADTWKGVMLEIDNQVSSPITNGMAVQIFTPEGQVFEYNKAPTGGIKIDDIDNVASSSKLVTGLIFMYYLNNNNNNYNLTLASKAKDFLKYKNSSGQWVSWSGALGELTLEHFLSMQSRIYEKAYTTADSTCEADSTFYIQDRKNFVDCIWKKFSSYNIQGGKTYTYGSTDLNLAAAMLESASGKSWLSLYKEALVDNLGIDPKSDYRQNTQVITPNVAGMLSISVKDYSKILEVFFNDGNWRGKQLIPKGIIKEFIKSRFNSTTKINYMAPIYAYAGVAKKNCPLNGFQLKNVAVSYALAMWSECNPFALPQNSTDFQTACYGGSVPSTYGANYIDLPNPNCLDYDFSLPVNPPSGKSFAVTSSPGKWGFYPFVHWQNQYYGVIGIRQENRENEDLGGEELHNLRLVLRKKIEDIIKDSNFKFIL